jgi:hypothetical protein
MASDKQGTARFASYSSMSANGEGTLPTKAQADPCKRLRLFCISSDLVGDVFDDKLKTNTYLEVSLMQQLSNAVSIRSAEGNKTIPIIQSAG